MAVSVLTRLTNQSRETGVPYQVCLQLFAQEDDGEPFEEKMKRFTSELYGLFEESHKLEDEICKKLSAIGYGKK